jgi:hypothetical protein
MTTDHIYNKNTYEYDNNNYKLKDFIEISINDIYRYYDHEFYIEMVDYSEYLEYLGYFFIKTNTEYMFKTYRIMDNKYDRYYNSIFTETILNCYNNKIKSNNKLRLYIHYKNHTNKLPEELLTQIKLNPRVLFKLKYIEDKMSDESKEYWKNNIYKK